MSKRQQLPPPAILNGRKKKYRGSQCGTIVEDVVQPIGEHQQEIITCKEHKVDLTSPALLRDHKDCKKGTRKQKCSCRMNELSPGLVTAYR